MDEVVAIVRASFPSVGVEVEYATLYNAVREQRAETSYLPAALRQLKAQGWLKVEVGRRAGDDSPKHRVIRIGA